MGESFYPEEDSQVEDDDELYDDDSGMEKTVEWLHEDELAEADTTAWQVASGARDPQGIPWELTPYTRAEYRGVRLQQYNNYYNREAEVVAGRARLLSEATPVSRGARLFATAANRRAVQPSIVHFQLRNLLATPDASGMYVVNDGRVLWHDAGGRSSSTVLDGQGGAAGPDAAPGAAPGAPDRIRGPVQLCTLAVGHGLVASGGFGGELLVAREDEGGGARTVGWDEEEDDDDDEESESTDGAWSSGAHVPRWDLPRGVEGGAAGGAAWTRAAGGGPGVGARGAPAGDGGRPIDAPRRDARAAPHARSWRHSPPRPPPPPLACARRITSSENGITNHLDVAPGPSGAPRVVASNNDDTVRVLDAATCRLLSSHALPWAVNATVARPGGSGRLLASVGDDPAAVLFDGDAAGGAARPVARLSGHLDFSFAAAWHPAGNLLATGNQDCTTRVYDVRRPDCTLALLPATAGAVRSLRFSPCGRFLAAAEPADYVTIYDVSAGFSRAQVVDIFGEVAGIAFTPESSRLTIAIADVHYASALQLDRVASAPLWDDLF